MTFHGLCFSSWKKLKEKEAADARNAEYYVEPDVVTTKVGTSDYNNVMAPK